MRTQNLISNRALRLQRKEQKEQTLLRFLRQHLWSTQDILQQVAGLSTRQAAHKTLTALEKRGLLRRCTYDALGGKVTIWGITHQGQASAFDVETESFIPVYFEPSRISEQTIHHELDLQRLSLVAESRGWKSWQDGNRLELQDKNHKRPDAIAKHSSGTIVAIECERTFKTLKRYEQILIQYLRWLKTGSIHEVVWLSPTSDMSKRLRIMLTSINDVRINGQKVLIEPERHHRHLHFCSYEQWKSFEFDR